MSLMDERELFIDSVKTGSVDNFHKYYKKEYLESKDNWCPIHYACVYNKTSILKLLIKRNCNIEACTEKSLRPIHFASRYGFSDIAEELISAKCDIEPHDEDDWTPLHHACSEGHMKIVEKLIHANCDIEATDKNKWRPIHHACLNQHIEIVVILMENNCNIQALTLSMQSPLHIANNMNNEKLKNILTYGISKEIYQIAQSMGVLCRYGCNHNLCSMSLILKTFSKKNLIGSGSFGKVYSSTSSQTNKIFAIKFINVESWHNNNINETITNELLTLLHPRIVRYYGAVVTLKHYCILMDRMPCSLDKKIEKDGKLCEDSIIHYSKQILEGLAFLHHHKIIHRDIKPQNILLDENDNVKLTDFDGSKIMKGSHLCFSRYFGTVNFVAPEVLNKNPYDYSADIWSVGATVINMIDGKVPYRELNTQAAFDKIKTSKTITFPLFISKDMDWFLRNMLNPEPVERLTASDLLSKCNLFNDK